MPQYYKDPDAVLDFLFDWSSWLASGESIDSHTVTVTCADEETPTLLVDSTSETSGIIFAWLSGGTAGYVYDVTCHMTTDNATPRTDDRTMKVRIQER